MGINVTVVGSVNQDFVVRTNTFVEPGETKTALSFETFIGGKGCNQAVAAKRAGANVKFIGAIGSDDFSNSVKKFFQTESIDFYSQTYKNTGMALIEIDNTRQNKIIVVPNANNELKYNDNMEQILSNVDVIVLQYEINHGLVQKIIDKFSDKVILNPSPYNANIVIEGINTLIVNETEFYSIIGFHLDINKKNKIVDFLLKNKIKNLVVTLGQNGVYYFNDREVIFQESFKVTVVDTTAAGDTFLGYYVANMNEDIKERLKIASYHASLCVSKKGAIPSIPSNKSSEVK